MAFFKNSLIAQKTDKPPGPRSLHTVSSFCHIVAFGEIKHTGMFETVAASTTGYLAAPKDKKLQKITPAFFNANKTNIMGSVLLQWYHFFLPVQFILTCQFYKKIGKTKPDPLIQLH